MYEPIISWNRTPLPPLSHHGSHPYPQSPGLRMFISLPLQGISIVVSPRLLDSFRSLMLSFSILNLSLPQATRDDVLDALDALDADSRPRGGQLYSQEEEKAGSTRSGSNGPSNGGVDLVSFIRLMRQKPPPTASKCFIKKDHRSPY